MLGWEKRSVPINGAICTALMGTARRSCFSLQDYWRAFAHPTCYLAMGLWQAVNGGLPVSGYKSRASKELLGEIERIVSPAEFIENPTGCHFFASDNYHIVLAICATDLLAGAKDEETWDLLGNLDIDWSYCSLEDEG